MRCAERSNYHCTDRERPANKSSNYDDMRREREPFIPRVSLSLSREITSFGCGFNGKSLSMHDITRVDYVPATANDELW